MMMNVSTFRETLNGESRTFILDQFSYVFRFKTEAATLYSRKCEEIHHRRWGLKNQSD
jgi:hypothetical protein